MIHFEVLGTGGHKKTFSFILGKWKQVDLFHVKQVPLPGMVIYSFVTVS